MCKKGLPAVWTKEKIEEAFAGFVEKNRRLPVAREMKPQYGLPTRRTFERYMDTTAQEYAELRYPTLLSARDERHVQTVLAYRNEVREWSIERLMEAEKNFFTKCGRLPEPYEYTAENGLPMSTWSGIRNKLENDYLCPALRGRIQYFATSYWESHDQTGRAAIRLDGVEVLRSNYYAYEQNYWNRYQALRREGVGEDDPKAPFRMAHEGTLNDGCFDNIFFDEAFHEFDNQSIEKSLTSENPLVRVFALLDRRLGKRRLLALEESMEQELDWVRAFYVTRMQAEGLMDRE